MGQPVGTTLEVTFKGTLINQTIMTVTHWDVLQVSTLTTLQEEYDALLNEIGTAAAGTLLGRYLDCLPENYTLDLITVQFTRPTRLVRSSDTQALAGIRDAAVAANFSSRITFRTQLAGRPFVGGISLPLGQLDINAGNLAGAYKTTLDLLAQKSLDNITPAVGGGIYRRVLVHPIASGLANTPVTSALVQDTSRVMRRRTVGLGI